MERLVVVGGGIGGLAAAWSAHAAAQEQGRALEIVLFEAEREVGGKALSLEQEGFLIEAGPTGYLDGEPVLDELVRRAGLEKLPANEAAARRYVARGGRLREIRPHPLRFATSGILSPLGMLRMLREPWLPKRPPLPEESVWDFAARRLGRQVAERLIAPMVLGVFAGDARRLSLPAAFPRMAELEAEHGSLFRALFALRKRRQSGGPAGPVGTLTSFAGGLQRLPQELARRAPFEVRTGARVEGIEHDGERWRLRAAGEALETDALVLAADLRPAQELLAQAAPALAQELAAIPSPGVVVVALAYGAEALARAPVGFGALIPRGEGPRILGVLWDTHLFAGRSPEGRLLMRAMIGGATDEEAASLSEQELAHIARADLAELLGIREEPELLCVVRWPAAIPQYELGHLARRERIDARLREFPGLHLAGNYLAGIAFGKSAARGWEVGARAATRPASS